jgi:hypothetical protein
MIRLLMKLLRRKRPPAPLKVTVVSNIRPHTCINARGGRRCDICFGRLP